MAIRAFLDKSGQHNSPYVTLAAFAGPDDAWAEFELGWNEVLKTGFRPVPYMHMVEAVGRRKGTPFSSDLGWEWEHVWDLVGKLLVFLGKLKKGQITMHSCVIDMEAWRELSALGCRLPSEIDLCNRYVSGYIVTMLAQKVLQTPADTVFIPKDDLLNFTFDRNEDFFTPFRDYINHQKAEAEKSGAAMWNLVDDIGEGDMKKIPGIQAADVLAWSINREKTVAEGVAGKYHSYMLHQVVMSFRKVWDREALLEKFGPIPLIPTM